MLKPQRFGRFILVDRLSTGGMAEVFLAKASGLQGFEKVVAIKRILPSVSEDSDFTTMFIDEAKISANLTHTNIGQVFEFGQVNGQYYIAMEYIPGRDLRAIHAHLADTGRVLELPVALHIATRVCQALDYAHRQKTPTGESMDIVHRDVSPPNVIVSYDGEVKLIDFGIAKATSRATRTRAGKLKGKFSYMSPEQVQGMPVDRRSDVFSLGVLLHELLTGQRLFHGENQLATLNMVRRAEVSSPSSLNPEVPVEVDRIVLKALSRDREQRYAWATELRADIERFLARTGVMFEGQQLAEWMRGQFPGEIEAERLIRDRIHKLQVDDLPDAEPPVEPVPSDLDQEDDDESVPIRGSSHRGLEGFAPDEVRGWLPGQAEAPEPRFIVDEVSPDRHEAITALGLVPSDHLDQLGASAGPEPGEDLPPTLLLDRPAELITGEPASESPSQTDPEMALVAADLGGDEDRLAGPDTNPRVFGPDSDRDDDPLGHAATLYRDVLPPTEREGFDQSEGELAAEDRASRSGAIVPGVERDATVVGGALEVASHPDHHSDPPEERVDLRAMGPLELEPSFGAVDPTTPSAMNQFGPRRWPGWKVAGIAAGATLTLAALVFVAASLGRSSGGSDGDESGSLVVTTQPPAACSVALGLAPKGMLQPRGSFTVTGLRPGRHVISLQCVGFRPYASTVVVKASEPSFLVARLAKNR